MSMNKPVSLPVSGDGLLVECWTRDWKVASFRPGRSGGRIFSSRVNFLCWQSFSVCSTPMLPQWHVKDPSHSAKSAGGRLQLNIHTPLTQESQSGLTAVQALVWEPSREKTSHTTHQGTLGHSHGENYSTCTCTMIATASYLILMSVLNVHLDSSIFSS